MDLPTLRRHSLLVGTIAAVVALLAAIGAVAAWSAFHDDTPATPKVEANLHFTPNDRQPKGLLEGDKTGSAVPTTQFPKLEGGLGSLADYKGTPVVLNFFGSWCVPCRKETPDLQKVHQELGDKVRFLGLAVNDSAKDAKAFVLEFGATYDIGRDANGKLFSELGGVNMPSTFFVSAEGKIVAAHAGALSASTLRDLITKNLLHP
jgi:thiol-disulfide isomerase/thioredoxin